MVRFFFEENRPVASVCHGAQLLTAAGVLEGPDLLRLSNLYSRGRRRRRELRFH